MSFRITHPTPMNRGFPSLQKERGKAACGLRGELSKNIHRMTFRISRQPTGNLNGFKISLLFRNLISILFDLSSLNNTIIPNLIYLIPETSLCR